MENPIEKDDDWGYPYFRKFQYFHIMKINISNSSRDPRCSPSDSPRKGLDNTEFHAAIAGAVSGAYHVRAVAEQYGVPVILHTDHCVAGIYVMRCLLELVGPFVGSNFFIFPYELGMSFIIP